MGKSQGQVQENANKLGTVKKQVRKLKVVVKTTEIPLNIEGSGRGRLDYVREVAHRTIITVEKSKRQEFSGLSGDKCGTGRIKCTACPRLFPTQRTLDYHYLKCPSISKKLKVLRRKGTCEEVIVDTRGKKQFCGKIYKSPKALANHKRACHRARWFCGECKKWFLETKKKDEHHCFVTKKEYMCECHEKYFNSAQALSAHLKKPTFLCRVEKCGKKFKTRREHNSHFTLMHKFSADASKECELCLATFTRNFAFKRHVKKQHGFDVCRVLVEQGNEKDGFVKVLCGEEGTPQSIRAHKIKYHRGSKCEKCGKIGRERDWFSKSHLKTCTGT